MNLSTSALASLHALPLAVEPLTVVSWIVYGIIAIAIASVVYTLLTCNPQRSSDPPLHDGGRGFDFPAGQHWFVRYSGSGCPPDDTRDRAKPPIASRRRP